MLRCYLVRFVNKKIQMYTVILHTLDCLINIHTIHTITKDFFGYYIKITLYLITKIGKLEMPGGH